MYVVRDYYGSLRLYLVKPKRQGRVWHTDDYIDDPQYITIQEDLYPNLKWIDDPIEVKFKKK